MSLDPSSQSPIFRGAGTQTLRRVGAYQVSGIPFVTGSNGQMTDEQEACVKFPNVTKSITVINSGSAVNTELRIHFVSSSAGSVTSAAEHHYITLGSTGDSVTFNVKCKEIYITSIGTAGFELFAELTTIPTSSMFDLNVSGSGLLGPGTDFSDF
tara:strand:+ start:1752 stop:2216 length:465 start_codon:yes stop_codon:yes gene_type:complete